MQKQLSFLLFTVLTILTVWILASCQDTPAPPTETNVTSDATTETKEEDLVIRYRVSEKELTVPLYDWYRKVQRTFDGKGMTHWNNTVARQLSCNWINVFPSGKLKTQDRGAPGAFLLDIDRIIEYTAPGLAESHKFGIKVITSAPISEVFPETWADYGLDADLVRAVNPNGQLSTTYQSGVSHACTFIQMFRDMLFDYTEKVAKAGFDGCLYDGNSYGCEPGFYCQCSSCKASWKQFSLEHLGKEVRLPSTTQDLENSETGRAFLIWRLKEFSGLLVALRDAGRQYNPDFDVYLNCEIFDLGNTYYYLNGLDIITSEYGTKMDFGHESTLFMFAHNEALTDRPLITFVQKFTDQFDNLYEYYVTMAESYAAGGAMCAAETIRSMPMEYYVNDIGVRFGEMVTNNAQAFTSSGNIADVAVVYSWQNGAFHQTKELLTFEKVGHTYPREYYETNASRQAASALAYEAIPFAYVVPEAAPAYEDIRQYQTLILPDMDLLDKNFEEILYRFVSEGGQVIISGNTFATRCPEGDGIRQTVRTEDLLKAWTGVSYAEADDYTVLSCGKGKIVICKTVFQRGNTGANIRLSDDCRKAFKEVDAYRLVKVEQAPTQGYFETTLRSNAYGTEMYLHLIQLGAASETYQAEKACVSVAIPEGATVVGAKATSPFCEKDDEIGLTYEVKDGRLHLSGEFNLYSMVTLSFTYAA